MSTPINLNKVRKAKAKADKGQRATENRAKFGRTKADKALEKTKAEKTVTSLDGHRLNQKPEDQG